MINLIRPKLFGPGSPGLCDRAKTSGEATGRSSGVRSENEEGRPLCDDKREVVGSRTLSEALVGMLLAKGR